MGTIGHAAESRDGGPPQYGLRAHARAPSGSGRKPWPQGLAPAAARGNGCPVRAARRARSGGGPVTPREQLGVPGPQPGPGGRGAVVAAAALVPEDMTVPAGPSPSGCPLPSGPTRACVSSHGSSTRSRPTWTWLSGTAPGCAAWTGPPPPAPARRSNWRPVSLLEYPPPRPHPSAGLTRERRCPHDPATVRCLPGHAGNHSPCAPGGKRHPLDVPCHRCGSHCSAETFRPGYRPPSEGGICSSGWPHDGDGADGGTNAVAVGLSWRWMATAARWIVVIPYAMVGLSWVSTTML